MPQHLSHLIFSGSLFICGGLLVPNAPQVYAAGAQGAPTIPPYKMPEEKPIKPDDAFKFLALGRTQRVFKEPLNLTVENASLEQVVTRIRTTLAARKGPALPRVEIRGVNPIKLGFTVKESTVGGVLQSAATLAGGKLWILGDYAVIAPEMALSGAESKAKEEGFMATWGTQAEGLDANSSNKKRRVLSNFVANELGGEKMAGGRDSKALATFGQLSPESQAMLRELAGDLKDWFDMHPPGSPGDRFNPRSDSFTLSPESQLRLQTVQMGLSNTALQVTSPSGERMSWSLGGNSMGFGGGPRVRPKPIPPLVHPSAGNS